MSDKNKKWPWKALTFGDLVCVCSSGWKCVHFVPLIYYVIYIQTEIEQIRSVYSLLMSAWHLWLTEREWLRDLVNGLKSTHTSSWIFLRKAISSWRLSIRLSKSSLARVAESTSYKKATWIKHSYNKSIVKMKFDVLLGTYSSESRKVILSLFLLVDLFLKSAEEPKWRSMTFEGAHFWVFTLKTHSLR